LTAAPPPAPPDRASSAATAACCSMGVPFFNWSARGATAPASTSEGTSPASWAR